MEAYDLFVSIGPNCRVASHLQKNNLIRKTSPLDWQMNYSLDTVLHLFETSFGDFFERIEEDHTFVGCENTRKVNDILNHIVSIHHFSKDVSLKNAQIEFRTKMKKRFIDLNTELKKAKKVVLVANRAETIEEFKRFLFGFKEIYPSIEICMINICNQENFNNDEFEFQEYYFSGNSSAFG